MFLATSPKFLLSLSVMEILLPYYSLVGYFGPASTRNIAFLIFVLLVAVYELGYS